MIMSVLKLMILALIRDVKNTLTMRTSRFWTFWSGELRHSHIYLLR